MDPEVDDEVEDLLEEILRPEWYHLAPEVPPLPPPEWPIPAPGIGEPASKMQYIDEEVLAAWGLGPAPEEPAFEEPAFEEPAATGNEVSNIPILERLEKTDTP
ncbi:hypothetical protein LSTR_LSTR014252 [Laodelphax striatellus]|uniref:Uncharacterized protein n=1 Tax=Laodelphax striatellus TaxID=195883 RepID=A0A482WE51_LAOST|nr:hypothetical protein LSTR_LSTR014252 [Laodelphax striatellus]